jgi:hypothetical protein
MGAPDTLIDLPKTIGSNKNNNPLWETGSAVDLVIGVRVDAQCHTITLQRSKYVGSGIVMMACFKTLSSSRVFGYPLIF